MARRACPRLWLLVLLVAAGVGLGVGTVAGSPASGAEAGSAGGSFAPGPVAPSSGVAITGDAVEAGVVPARTEIGRGAAGQPSPGRSALPLVAALVAGAGLVGLRRGRPILTVAAQQPLLARRHAVALRAPPASQLV